MSRNPGLTFKGLQYAEALENLAELIATRAADLGFEPLGEEMDSASSEVYEILMLRVAKRHLKKPWSAGKVHAKALEMLLNIDTPGSFYLYEFLQAWRTTDIMYASLLLNAIILMQSGRDDEAIEWLEIGPGPKAVREDLIGHIEAAGGGGYAFFRVQEELESIWGQMTKSQPKYAKTALQYFTDAPAPEL